MFYRAVDFFTFSFYIPMEILGYTSLFILFCIDYLVHYKYITSNFSLDEKQRAHILSTKNSLTMFLVGIYFNYYYFTSKFNETGFLGILETTDSKPFGKVLVLYFAAYLVMDIYIGNAEYHSFMNNITGYFHHTVYSVISAVSLMINIYPMYLLHMVSELPTFLLSVSKLDAGLRDDSLFGAAFFTTRIAYHVLLTFLFRKHTLFFTVSLLALGLHSFWFYKWYIKYAGAPASA